MGITSPDLPTLDYEQWRAGDLMSRLKPIVRHWVVAGLGTPDVTYLVYIAKIVGYLAGAMLFASITPGVGSFGTVGSWWTEPVVYEKLVIWTALFEVVGLGCGFGPLAGRFVPPFGSLLYWLRPGTIRLPPWPGKVPFTRGTRRTVGDALLYLGVLAAAVFALLSPATRHDAGLVTRAGLLEPERILPLLIVLPLIGLRDKTIFLAARSEVYLPLLVAFLLPGADLVVTAKLAILMIWWGAATSKLNRHFPHVVAVMESNSPALRGRWLKSRFYRHYPDDVRPSRLAEFLAYAGTGVEYLAPLALFVSRGGTVTVVAAVVMLLFHLHILASIPSGVPLEWNVFMMFSIAFLFVHNARYGPGDLTHPLPVVLLTGLLVGAIVLGNLCPNKVSFLVGMRYYAGNWDTSMWCLTPGAIAKIERHVIKAGPLPGMQLVTMYGERVAELFAHKVYAFRAMHLHGRALLGLIPRACGSRHETDYVPTDGEVIVGPIVGWNFGDGHMHNEQLIQALHERCRFDEGEVRVIVLDAQPIQRQRQEYRLVDAATGEFERGYVRVRDMLDRQPWDGDIPVTVLATQRRTGQGADVEAV
ncbi:MAG: DUF3556 domain-containing protein [Kutzneria sp.]|nr:DUF3556 domain-containing protein [Kutzneria sp.]